MRNRTRIRPLLSGATALVAVVSALAVVAMLFVGCPNPITNDIAAEAMDRVAPTIEITEPAPNVQEHYTSTLDIKGTVSDKTNGGTAGHVDRLTYVGVNTPLLHGEIAIAQDGAFELSIPRVVIGEYALTGNQRFDLTATDWNNNSATVEVTLYDRNTGPEIIITDPDPDLDAWYSSVSTAALVISGQVEAYNNFSYTVVDTQTLAELIPETGITSADVDRATGDFSISIDAAGWALSGDISVNLMTLEDTLSNLETVEYQDDPIAPVVTGTLINNGTIQLTFDEPVYGPGGGDITESDIQIDTTYPSGFSVPQADGVAFATPITIPAGTQGTVTLPITVSGTPNGSEGVEVTPSGVFDHVENPATPSVVTLAGTLSDEAAPYVTSLTTSLPAGGSIRAGQTVDVQIEFNEDLVVGTPIPSLSLTLDSGGPATAAYTGQSPAGTLNFTYTVESGDNAAVLAVGTLSGNIRDADDNAADLDLPTLLETITVDTTPPATPTVTIEDGADNTINIAENGGNMLHIVLGATGAGEAVSYTTSATNATVSASGATAPTLDLPLTATGGPVSVTVTVYDEAGNSTAAPAATAAIDIVAPPAPGVSISGGDTINIAENPATVTLTGGESGTNLTISNLTNCSIYGTAPTTLNSYGEATFQIQVAADGAVSFRVTVTDAAGNSTVVTPDPNTDADITAPTAPAVVVSGGPEIIYSENPATVTLSGGEPGTSLSVTSLVNCTFSVAPPATLNGSGGATFAIQVTTDGPVSFSTTVTDAAGNTTAVAPNPTNLTADISLPTEPTVVINGGSDINVASNPAAVTITGGDAGSILTIGNETNCTVSGEPATLDGTGGATFTVTATNDGTVSFSVTVSDTAGNQTVVSPTPSVEADIHAPGQPTVAIAGSPTINISENPAQVTLSGSEAFSTLAIGDLVNCSVSGTPPAALNASGGATFSILAADDGAVTFSITLTDAFGNQTVVSPAPSFDADIHAPTEPTVVINGGSDINIASLPAPVTITGGDAGSTLTISGESNCTVSGAPSTLDGSGEASFTVTPDGDGEISFSVTVSDAAGNQTVVSPTPTAQADITAPFIVSATIEDGADNAINNAESLLQLLRIEVAAYGGDDAVSYSATATNATVATPGTIDALVTALELTGLTDGTTVSVEVTVYDSAGNSVTATTENAAVHFMTATSPTVTIADGGDGISEGEYTGSVAVDVTGGVPGATYSISTTNCTTDPPSPAEVILVSGGANAGTGSFDITSFSEGTVTVSITYTDTWGNTSYGEDSTTAAP